MSPQPDDSTNDRLATQTTDNSLQMQSYILPSHVLDQFNPDNNRRQRDIQKDCNSVNRSSANANRKTKMIGGILYGSQGKEIPGTSQDVFSPKTWSQLVDDPRYGGEETYNWNEDGNGKSNQPGLGGSTSPSSPKSTRSANSRLGRLVTKSARSLRNAFRKGIGSSQDGKE